VARGVLREINSGRKLDFTSGSRRKVRPPKYEVMVTYAAPHGYVVLMSAMHSDATPGRIVLPRKIRAIRQALTPEQRVQFAAELDDIDAGGLRAVVEKWWLTAVLNMSGTWERVEAVKAGAVRTVPVEDVIPDFAELFEQRHSQPYVGHAGR